jgi:hypothetical protein
MSIFNEFKFTIQAIIIITFSPILLITLLVIWLVLLIDDWGVKKGELR